MKVLRISIIFILVLLLLNSVCKRQFYKTKEARGLWVSRFEWVVKSDTNRMEAQQKRIIEILEKANEAKMNFILFQIRGHGDAFYQSGYEPWSDMLTGTLGSDPGWDPLEFAVAEAHKRGLELHVWFNTFTAWRGETKPPQTNPQHIINAHPEWVVCDVNGNPMKLNQHYVFLSPGMPEVREYIHRVAMDIVQRYNIDGFHFDYIRYPENSNKLGYSHDSISVRLFNSVQGNPKQLNWEDWQRENINQFVATFYDEATAVKPWLKISAAVIGKYDFSDWNGYFAVFQDARQWLSAGKMDFIAPMIYWQTNHPTAPFGRIVKDWLVNYLHQRYIFPGISISKLGTEEWPVKELLTQIYLNREYDNNGMLFFSYGGMEAATQGLEEKGFPYLANIPPMSWKDDTPPLYPKNLKASFIQPDEVLLEWDSPDSLIESTDVWRYNIFRSNKSPVKYNDARNLIHITATNDTTFFDSDVELGKKYYYVVTALDRVNNESPPSNELEVKIPSFVMSETKFEKYSD